MNEERFGFRIVCRGKVTAEEFGFASQDGCAGAARSHPEFNKATTVSILRDSGGTDHPDNRGKYFLHRFLKA